MAPSFDASGGLPNVNLSLTVPDKSLTSDRPPSYPAGTHEVPGILPGLTCDATVPILVGCRAAPAPLPHFEVWRCAPQHR